MKRRNHGLLFAILLLALINLSPSKNSARVVTENADNMEMVSLPNQEKVQEEGHITVGVQMDAAAFLRLQKMNQTYVNEHPIKVDLVNEPIESSYSSLQHQLELGESPDVLLLDNVWIRRFAAKGYILPTENYYSGSLTGEVFSNLLLQNEWNSYVWGVPLDADPYVLVYNSAIINDLGFVNPPSTVEEWKSLISAFSAQSKISHLLGLNYDDPYATISLLWQLGGREQEVNGASPFELTEELNGAIQQAELLRPYLLNDQELLETNEQTDENTEDVWEKLYNGKLAMILIRASAVEVRDYPGIEISLSELTDSGRTMWVGGRSYAVSAQTDNAEAAGAWISEMTAQAQQRNWFETTGHLPVLKSLYFDYSDNAFPKWVSDSLVNKQGGTLPVGTELPIQMEGFSGITGKFLRGSISTDQYITQLSQIAEEPL